MAASDVAVCPFESALSTTRKTVPDVTVQAHDISWATDLMSTQTDLPHPDEVQVNAAGRRLLDGELLSKVSKLGAAGHQAADFLAFEIVFGSRTDHLA